MEADKQFLRELKEVDDLLDVDWNSRKHRWQIVRDDRRLRLMGFADGKPLLHSYDRPYFVFMVEGEAGEYRPLDQRVIDRLHEIDTHRYAKLSDFVKEVEKEEDSNKNKQAQQQSEMVQELTKDNWHRIKDSIEKDSFGRHGSS